MTASVRVLLALALALAGCNPYTSLPAPRCRSFVDCLPGSYCHEQHCEMRRSLELVHASPDPLVVWVVGSRADGDVLADEHARLVRVDEVAAEEHVARLEGLPEIPLWLVVWSGGGARPCAGSSSFVGRAPREGRLRVALSAWRTGCGARPQALGYADHALFASPLALE